MSTADVFDPAIRMSDADRLWLGCYLAATPFVLLVLLVVVWPVTPSTAESPAVPGKLAAPQNPPAPGKIAALLGTGNTDVRLLLLAAIAGGLGSCIHAATSFATFAGNRTLAASWNWWYVLRMGIGMSLALLVYFATRGGGLFSSGAANNAYGIAAVAGMAGLFSKQATDKLQEVFDNLLQTKNGEGDSGRKDKADGRHAAVISSIKPESLPKDSSDLDIVVSGQGFDAKSTVQVNGIDRETKFVSDKQLTSKLVAADVANSGDLKITVRNTGDGSSSQPIAVKVK
jgi:hypothetical protein